MILGIDVSKDKLDIYVLPHKQHHTIKNSKASLQSFFKNQCPQGVIKQVIFEATGGYEKPVHSYVLAQEIPHHRVHPLKARRFAESRGVFAKTDRMDAKGLADYADQLNIKADEQISMTQLKIQEYSSRRTQLKEMLNAETHRLKVIHYEAQISQSIKRHIKQLEKELALITEKLNQRIESDQTLQAKRQLLKTAKGIGEEVSTLLVTDLPELGQLNREQISRLVGVAPQTRDSGKLQRYRPISQGRFYVRKALYMAALVASRHDPRMKNIYNKLIAKGKPKKVALVALMRKMIIMLNAMIKHQSPWQSQRI